MRSIYIVNLKTAEVKVRPESIAAHLELRIPVNPRTELIY